MPATPSPTTGGHWVLVNGRIGARPSRTHAERSNGGQRDLSICATGSVPSNRIVAPGRRHHFHRNGSKFAVRAIADRSDHAVQIPCENEPRALHGSDAATREAGGSTRRCHSLDAHHRDCVSWPFRRKYCSFSFLACPPIATLPADRWSSTSRTL